MNARRVLEGDALATRKRRRILTAGHDLRMSTAGHGLGHLGRTRAALVLLFGEHGTPCGSDPGIGAGTRG